MDTCTCCNNTKELITVDDVIQRYRETSCLTTCLIPLAKSQYGWYRLYRCRVCGQYWQSSYWEWRNETPNGIRHEAGEVLYPVPPTDPLSWMDNPYLNPIPIAEARSKIQYVEEASGPEVGPERCRVDGCTHLHVANSVFCRQHHIENLHRIGILPPDPDNAEHKQ